MIPLIEKDITITENDGLLILYCGVGGAEKLRGQILKNQEDAERLPEAEFALKHEQDLFEKLYLESKQDHEIVELVKKRIEVAVQAGKEGSQAEEYVEIILQKLLDGKK